MHKFSAYKLSRARTWSYCPQCTLSYQRRHICGVIRIWCRPGLPDLRKPTYRHGVQGEKKHNTTSRVLCHMLSTVPHICTHTYAYTMADSGRRAPKRWQHLWTCGPTASTHLRSEQEAYQQLRIARDYLLEIIHQRHAVNIWLAGELLVTCFRDSGFRRRYRLCSVNAFCCDHDCSGGHLVRTRVRCLQHSKVWLVWSGSRLYAEDMRKLSEV